jgi:hypothetical protein
MRYPMPHYPCDFEIPDDWLHATGMTGFAASGDAFRSHPDAVLLPLTEIEPPFRMIDYPKDFRGFDRARLISVFEGIAAGAVIEPVPVATLPRGVFPFSEPFKYRVRDGYHRFYASIAAGFRFLPAVVH